MAGSAEFDPLGPNETTEERTLNRRVAIVFRDLAAAEIIGRDDIDKTQKQKILYDNAVAFFGQP